MIIQEKENQIIQSIMVVHPKEKERGKEKEKDNLNIQDWGFNH